MQEIFGSAVCHAATARITRRLEAEIILVPELAADAIFSGESLCEAHERLLARLKAFTTSEHARLDAMARERELYAKS